MPTVTTPLRNTSAEVQELTDFTRDCTVFVRAADLIVNESLLDQGLSEARLKMIALYLAAHFATISEERGALSASTMGESAERFHNVYKEGFKSTRFGQQALALDPTGILAELNFNAENSAKLDALFTVI